MAGDGLAARRSGRWSTVSLLLILNIVALLDRQVISLLVEPIKAYFRISDVQIGLLQGTAFAVLYCTCAIPLGWAVDRYSRRWVIFFGVFVWGVATMASGLARSFDELLVARIFVGMGEAALAPAAFSILSDLFDRSRLAFALSVYSTGSVFGAALALAVSGILASRMGHGLVLPLIGPLQLWQSILFVVGAPGLLLSFLIFTVAEPARSRISSGTADFGALWRFARENAAFLGSHMAGFALLLAIAYANLAWLPAILQRYHGMSLAEAGVSLGVIMATAGIFGNLLNGGLVDLLYKRGYRDAHLRYYSGCAVVIAFFAASSMGAGSATVYLLLLVPVLLLAQQSGVAAAAIQITTPGVLRGKMSAVYLLLVNLFGMTMGPYGVAAIAKLSICGGRLNIALGILSFVAAVLATVCFWLGLGPMRRAIIAAEKFTII
jgi:predicted MFS family arabinose efflux permease